MRIGEVMRNSVLDQWRLIAAFMVILLHAPLPGVCGLIAESLSRVAVPFFFMISGYYAYGRSVDDRKKKMRRTLVLLAWSVSLYFLWEVLFSFYHGTTEQKLRMYFSARTLFETLVLNTGALLGHLWFLLALLYCYLIYHFWIRKAPWRIKLAVSVALSVGFFLVRELLQCLGVSDPVYYVRNFFFVGLPCFSLGNIICEKKEQLSSIRGYIWGVTALLGAAAVVAERILKGSCDLYYGTLITCVSLFVLAQSQGGWSNRNLSAWGGKYSGDIYIFHVMIIGVVNIAGSILGVLYNRFFLLLRPFIVLAISIAVAVLKDRIVAAVSRKSEDK